jgi:hypothetical protein
MSLPTVTLTSTVGGSALPFTLGHFFKQGDIPTGSVCGSDLTDWQCIANTFYSDGSIHHATLSGRATFTAGVAKVVTLSAVSPPGGTALTQTDLATRLAALSATTLVTGAQTVTLSSLVSTSAMQRQVYAGPIMSNWLYRAAITGSTHLVAWFDVRLYLGGQVEILPVIENGYLLVASPDTDTRTYTFTLNGSSKFSASVTAKHHTTNALLDNSGSSFKHWSYWSGSDPQTEVAHDLSYLRSTLQVPNYRAISPSAGTLNAIVQTFTPGGTAGVSSMGNGGTSASILGHTESHADALYCVTADARAYRGVLAFGFSSGSWPVHFRDSATNEPFLWTTYPNASLQNQDTPTIPEGAGGTNGAGNETAPRTHQPNYGFLAFGLTGRDYFREESVAWVNHNYLQNVVSARNGADGLMQSAAGANDVRGAAWAIRTLAMTLRILPTTHVKYADLLASWQANVLRYHADCISGGGALINNLGLVPPYINGNFNPGYGGFQIGTTFNVAHYMHMFHPIVWGFARDLGLPGTVGTQLAELSDWCYKLPVGLAGDPSTGWDWRWFAPYQGPAGFQNTRYFTSWKEGYDTVVAVGAPYTPPTGNILYRAMQSDTPWVGYEDSFYGYHRAALAMAVGHGAAGASAAWARVTGADNYASQTALLENSPTYAFEPRTATVPVLSYAYSVASGGTIYGGKLAPVGAAITGTVARTQAKNVATAFGGDGSLPTWMAGQAVNAWREVAGSSLSAITITDPGISGTGVAAIVDAWCGATIDTRTWDIWLLAQSGHTDGSNNGVYTVQMKSNTPTFRVRRASTALADINPGNNAAYLPNGDPAAIHSYRVPKFCKIRNRALRVGAPAVWQTGNSFVNIDGYSSVTADGVNGWDAAGTYPNVPAGGTEMTMCMDPVLEDIYVFFYNNAVYKWTQTSNTWSQINVGFPPNISKGPAVYDTSRARCFTVNSGGAWTFNPATGTFTARTLTGSYTAECLTDYCGMVYDPTGDRYLLLNADTSGAVYAIDPVTFATSVLATTNNTVPNGAGGAAGACWDKLLIADNMLFYIPRYSANVWALRIH